jgi:hypothetical protein
MFTKLQKAAQWHLSQLFSIAYARQSRAAHLRRTAARLLLNSSIGTDGTRWDAGTLKTRPL